MRYQRPAIIGASLLAFTAAVAIMIPPTKPIGGAKITSTTNQGFSPVTSVAPDENKPSYPTYPSDAPPMASTTPAQSAPAENEAADDNDDDDRDVPQARIVQAPPAPVVPPLLRPRAPVRQTPRADPRYAYADDAPAFAERDFRQGYRWAQQSEVEDRRACRELDGAMADGCRAYLRDADARSDDDDRDDRDDRPW